MNCQIVLDRPRQTQTGAGRSRQVQTGPDRSRQVLPGPDGSRQVRTCLDRSRQAHTSPDCSRRRVDCKQNHLRHDRPKAAWREDKTFGRSKSGIQFDVARGGFDEILMRFF